MRRFVETVFDEWVYDGTMYTSSEHDELLGSVDRLAFQAIIDAVSGEPEVTIEFESSFDDVRWKSHGGPIVDVPVSSGQTNILVGTDDGATTTLERVRLKVSLSGVSVKARVRIIVCGRDRSRVRTATVPRAVRERRGAGKHTSVRGPATAHPAFFRSSRASRDHVRHSYFTGLQQPNAPQLLPRTATEASRSCPPPACRCGHRSAPFGSARSAPPITVGERNPLQLPGRRAGKTLSHAPAFAPAAPPPGPPSRDGDRRPRRHSAPIACSDAIAWPVLSAQYPCAIVPPDAHADAWYSLHLSQFTLVHSDGVYGPCGRWVVEFENLSYPNFPNVVIESGAHIPESHWPFWLYYCDQVLGSFEVHTSLDGITWSHEATRTFWYDSQCIKHPNLDTHSLAQFAVFASARFFRVAVEATHPWPYLELHPPEARIELPVWALAWVTG